MSIKIPQGVAYTFRIGPFLDSTNGDTEEGALTITQPDIRLSKAGGDFAQLNASGTLTYDESGHYILTLDTTDTNTVGQLRVYIHESGALPVWQDFQVMSPGSFYAQYGDDAVVIWGACDATGTTTTVEANSAFRTILATDDALIGRVLVFKRDTTTTALRGQASVISDYDATGGTITVNTAFTVASNNLDEFLIY